MREQADADRLNGADAAWEPWQQKVTRVVGLVVGTVLAGVGVCMALFVLVKDSGPFLVRLFPGLLYPGAAMVIGGGMVSRAIQSFKARKRQLKEARELEDAPKARSEAGTSQELQVDDSRQHGSLPPPDEAHTRPQEKATDISSTPQSPTQTEEPPDPRIGMTIEQFKRERASLSGYYRTLKDTEHCPRGRTLCSDCVTSFIPCSISKAIERGLIRELTSEEADGEADFKRDLLGKHCRSRNTDPCLICSAYES